VREALQSQADTILPANAQAFLPGYNGQQELFRYYREKPVDVFINVSISEGTPVSAMEAASCGIPIIATAVGGNKEMINAGNGFLLDPNPTPGQIARTLFSMIDHPQETARMRAASRAVWQEKYNSVKNLEKFFNCLKSLRESK
jgi:glycosyltransferase involved in cell wall biosynthesis